MSNDQGNDTARLSEFLGRPCHWLVPQRNGEPGEIGVHCTVKNARHHFGRDEFLVEPTEGYGNRWVWAKHCELL